MKYIQIIFWTVYVLEIFFSDKKKSKFYLIRVSSLMRK